MEGYSNVNANLHNFDDLDIEGRIVDDWNQDADFPGIKEDEQKRILETKVHLDDGTFGEMCSVVKRQHGFSYTCHVCTITCSGWPQFKIHLGSTKHLQYMRLPEHPRKKFVKLDPNEDMALEPGEPVPPGLEQVVITNCQIQPIIDAYTSGPLIGLEYLVELNSDFETDLEYICLLCEKVGKNRSILGHMTSQGHYKRYISLFFRSAVKLYNEDLPRNNFYRQRCAEVVTRIAKKIETKYGRMKPRFEHASSFPSRKLEVLREIEEGHHFREAFDDRFDDCLLVTDPSPTNKASVNAGENDLSLSKIKKTELTEGSQAKPDPNKNKNIPLSQIDTNSQKNTVSDIKQEGSSESKEEDPSKSIFNKGKINAEKRHLRPRDESKEDRKSSSPEIVGIEIAPPSIKKHRKSPSVSSISLSTNSRSKSRSRSGGRIKSRERSRSGGKIKSRERSRTKSRPRSPHRTRGRSPYNSRYRSRSWNRSYGRYPRRSRSPSARRYRMRRRSRSRGRYRSRSGSRSRSPSYSDRFGRTIRTKRRENFTDYRPKKKVYHSDRASEDDGLKHERRKWEKFREEFLEIETSLFEKLKYFEKNPEKHPQYPEEWKVFWNKRYKEIQAEGKDPAKHDFKPEWIVFWTKRMKEIHEDDLKKRKELLKDKFGLPSDEPKHHFDHKEPMLLEDVSPPTPDKKDAIADIKNTWKALTGSDIKESKRPLSPWEEESKPQEQPSDKGESRSDHHRSSHRNRDRSPDRRDRDKSSCFVDNVGTVVSLLRKLAVLESSLGSLGPRVLDLLSKALALDKASVNGSRTLLEHNEHCVFLETVKEKLKGLLFAGVVARNMVNTTRSAIRSIDHLISEAPTIKKDQYNILKPIMIPVKPTTPVPVKPVDPVSVPGVGRVDKVAIAQQIATALIQQGRTNVTEDELEQLINAVVGMAEASTNSSQPISAAAYVSQMQLNPGLPVNPETQVQPSASSGLKLLQSAYDEVTKPDLIDLTGKVELSDNKTVEDLSETDLKNLVQNFNDLSDVEKRGLKNYLNKLEESSPETITRLKPVIPPNILASTPTPAKRSPIVIPISKEKSEQKVKPTEQETGRLSPFSMRSGGINPTSDNVELDSANPSKPVDEVVTNLASKLPVLVQDVDDDDDDDDDDYSFEDVYKAASEKLRLKQIEEDKAKQADVSITPTLNSSNEAQKTLTSSSDVSNSKLPQPITISESKTGNQINSIGDNHNNIPAKTEEYQVNINNFAQFASNTNPMLEQYPEQDYAAESYGYSDGPSGQQRNYPGNYNQHGNYPPEHEVETDIPGLDTQGNYSNLNLQSNLPNRNFQGIPIPEPQIGYSNRNLQSNLPSVHDSQNILSAPFSGYPNRNLPNRNLQANVTPIPPNRDTQTGFSSSRNMEESFFPTRNQSSGLPGNYLTNFKPGLRDEPSNLSSGLNLPSNRTGRFNEFDNGSRYPVPRVGSNLPYPEQSYQHRENDSAFYPNRSYPFDQNASTNQQFNRYQNIPPRY